MALDFACGWECRLVTASATNSPAEPHWNSYTGTPSVSTTTFRTGLAAARLNPAGATKYFGKAVNRKVVAARVYLRFATFPVGVTTPIISFVNASGTAFVRAQSTGQLYLDVGAGSDQTFGSPLSLDTWYQLDLLADSTGSDTILKGRLDGGSEVTAQVTQASVNFTDFRIGATAAVTFDMFCDDLVLGTATGDYPIGAGTVEGLHPDADGTHSFTAGDFGYDAAGANVGLSDTNVYTYVDDPALSTITDFIRQKVVRTTGYVEVQFPDPVSTADPQIVNVVLSMHSSGTTANTVGWKLNDGGTILGINDAAGDFLSDISNTARADISKGFATKPSSGAWTLSAIQGLRVRYGYAGSVGSFPYWDGVVLEVAFPEGASTQDIAPALINQAAATFAPTRTSSNTYAPALIDQTAVAHQPTITKLNTYTPALLNQQAAVFSPTITTGAVSASVGIINQPAATFTPTVTQSSAIVLGLIDRTASTAPSQGLDIQAELDVSIPPLALARVFVHYDTTIDSGYSVELGDDEGGLDYIRVTRYVAGSPTILFSGSRGLLIDDDWVMQFAAFGSEARRVIRWRTWRPGTDAVPWWSEIIDTSASFVVYEEPPFFELLGGATDSDFDYAAPLAADHIGVTNLNTYTPALISQTATTFDPTISVGAAPVSVGLISQTAATFTPTVSSVRNLTLGLISQTASPFTPTVTKLNTYSPALISQTAATFAPTVTTSASIAPALINQAASPFAPTISVGAAPITIGLLSQPAATFTPTVLQQRFYTPALLSNPAATFAPTVTTQNHVGLGMISVGHQTGDMHVIGRMSVATDGPTHGVYLRAQGGTADQSFSVHLFGDAAGIFEFGNDRVVLVISRVDSVNEASLTLATVDVGAFENEDLWWVEFEVSGDPTAAVVEARAWADGDSPPSWVTTGDDYPIIARTDDTTLGLEWYLFAPYPIFGHYPAGAGAYAPTTTTANAISLGLLDQTAASYAPTITTGAVPISIGLINQTAQTSSPTISVGVAAVTFGRIEQAAAPFTPTTTTLSAISLGQIVSPALAISPTVTTQSAISVGRIEQVAATFAPVVTTGVVVVSVGLISSPATSFAPVISTGVATISLGRINQAAVAFEPAAVRSLGLGFIDQTAVISPATVITQQFVAVALLDRSAQAHAPDITGAGTIALALISQPTGTYAPTVTAGSASVSVGRIDQTAVIYAPSISASASISLALIDRTAVADAPSITIGGVPQSVALGRIDQTATALAPSLASLAFVAVGTINQSAQLFAPSTFAIQSASLGRIEQAASTFAPTLTTGLVVVQLGRVEQAAQAHAPSLSQSLSVGRIERAATPFAPAVSAHSAVSLPVISVGVVFAPTVSGPQVIGLAIISRPATPFTPSVGEPSRGEGAEIIIYTDGGPRVTERPRPRRPKLPRPAPRRERQMVGFATIAINPHAFEPDIEREDDLVLLGLDDDSLLNM